MIILLHAHVGLASCDQCLAVIFAWEVVGPHHDQIIQIDVDGHNYRFRTCHVMKFKTPASQYWSVLVHVLHCSYDMKRKPRPHDGTDLDKNRLVESSLSDSDPPDDGLTRIQ